MNISQREARRLRKRVAELEQMIDGRNKRWAREYPGGVGLGWINVDAIAVAQVRTARLLGHAVVVIASDPADKLGLFALPEAHR
jgi:hypothetical protein